MRDQMRLTWRLLRDERVTTLKYVLPALLLLYIASPVDFIPDALLGIGQTDDLGVAIAAVMVLVRVVPRLAPEHVVDDHVRQMSGDGRTTGIGSMGARQTIDAKFSVRG